MGDFFINLLIIIVAYLGYLAIWAIINLLAYFLTLALKQHRIMNFFVGLSATVYYIFSFGLGLIILWYIITLLFSGNILMFLFMLFIGISILLAVINFLQLPFLAIPIYFQSKLEHVDFKEEIEKAELIDEKGKIISVSESDLDTNRRIAIWFCILYTLNLFSLIINRVEYEGYMWGDYITTPFLWMISQIIFFGLIVGIYFKIKKGKFFYISKRYLFGNTLKVGSFALLILTVIFLWTQIWVIK